MSAPQGRLEFAPPPTPGLLRSLGLAILAHGVLLAVLTAGVAWKREPVVATVEAELWSAVPQEAAPAPAEEPPAEPPLPTPEPKPAPQPEAKPAPPPEPTKTQADIAQAREKAQREKAQAEKDRLEKEKLARTKQEKLEKERLEKQKLEKEKLAKEKAQKDQREKKAKEAQQAKEAAAKEAREAKRLEQDRQNNIQRMQKMAGGSGSGTGASNATGSAAQASGPSAGYMGRIVARIKPNIVFTDSVAGNPRAEVEIRVAPTGAILSARVTQSSGIKAWDDAVLRAIEKTEVLPKDTDGSVPTSMQIGFRPKD